jgi:hypothetical protein
MTETLTIDRIAVTSSDDGHGWAERVNRIVDRVAGVRLDQTLRSRPLAAEGEWLIRRVAVSAALNFGRPDASLEDALSRAVLDAIADAVGNGADAVGDGDVVYYRRPVDGLADLVASAAARRFERAWAWARLGLIADVDSVRREPASCVLNALATRPDQALTAVSRAAARVGLAPLHRLFGDAGWIRLADIVIGAHLAGSTAHGAAAAMVRDGTVDISVDVGPGDDVPGIFVMESPRALRLGAGAHARGGGVNAGARDLGHASRLVGSSPIAAAARGSRLRLVGPTVRALAVLVVAESEPAALARTGGVPLCLTVAAMLAGTVQPIPETPNRPSDIVAPGLTRDGGCVGGPPATGPSADGITGSADGFAGSAEGITGSANGIAAHPQDAAAPSAAGPSANGIAGSANGIAAHPQDAAAPSAAGPSANGIAAHPEDATPSAAGPSANRVAAYAEDAAAQHLDEPSGEHTNHAGLLYLLNAAADAAMPDLLFADPVLDGIPGSELLARVALWLVTAADDDPAVLTFAGLEPWRVRRGWSRAPLPVAAQRRIDGQARAWAQAAAARLDRDEDLALVVAGVTDRSGRIEREPGWVDVHLALADVDVDVRRAGLDLDPGWVPWLGCVVRFCYA